MYEEREPFFVCHTKGGIDINNILKRELWTETGGRRL